MTQSDTTGRANRDGHPCPRWCTADHDMLVVADKPQYGHMKLHVSGPVATPPEGWPAVRLVAGTGPLEVPAVELQVRRANFVSVRLVLGAEQADQLSAILRERDPGDLLADQLLAAAAIAREAW